MRGRFGQRHLVLASVFGGASAVVVFVAPVVMTIPIRLPVATRSLRALLRGVVFALASPFACWVKNGGLSGVSGGFVGAQREAEILDDPRSLR